MIAELSKPFQKMQLYLKISYHLDKIEMGVAKELYNSTGDSLYDMHSIMPLVASLNDRVKLPYIEIVLSSPVGEELTDHKFVELALEYLKEMGYEESCYSIIKHEDKVNKHIHILATKVDINGIRIKDSMSQINSGKVMRKLEKKYDIEVMEKGKSTHNKTLGESLYRQYFFDTALHKALRSHNANERVNRILQESDTFKIINPDLTKPYTNSEWKVMLGDEVYEKALKVLSDSKFFNPLYKDELLAVMDRIYPTCKNVSEFRDQLEKEYYYMRLISDKGKSYYVYGIPERSFYVKDKDLPEKYRFGRIVFEGQRMSPDEQKHYLYNKIFAVLSSSLDYNNFRIQLAENNITLIEHTNKLGIYGLSFSMANVICPEIFKSSEISRRLTYRNIQDHFRKEEDNNISIIEDPKEKRTRIEPIIVCYSNTKQEWERDLNYMLPGSMLVSTIPLDNETGKKRKEEEDPRAKKKRNKGLSI